MNQLSSKYVPVILAGGSGTRLWPLSRKAYPKQFLALNGERSLLQTTVQRFSGTNAAPPVLVCSEDHRFLVVEQLEEIDCLQRDILLESSARNTAPAIAAAAWHISATNPDAIMVVLPADHLITDVHDFQQTIEQGVQLAQQGALITLGVTPERAEIEYGYIQADNSATLEFGAMAVNRFIEKPDKANAEKLIQNPACFWNAGIFMFKASAFLEVLLELEPAMHAATEQAVSAAVSDLDFLRVDKSAFDACENISVDYAIMEKASNVKVLPFQSSWSDIGNWGAVHQSSHLNEDGNSSVGDAIHHACKDTYLHASSRMVMALGTSNISVIETADVVLVIDHNSSASIKAAIEVLKAQNRTELETHTTCYRPWGHYESLKLHPRFQVKRISVKPGARLSLQKHFHRSEHWVVVRGTAIVTNGEDEILLTENESTYIPLGTMHRLHNPGTIALELIEVQSGSYLGEDDIVRVGDEYGRA